jgi:hypothetical protein
LLLRPRSEDEPVAGGVRAAVEAGGGDAGRDADSGRAVARRELGELNSSRLATPRRDHDEPRHRHLLGPADNRAILATAKERVNHAECVVAHQTGRVEALDLILTPCWTRRRLRRLPTRCATPGVGLVPASVEAACTSSSRPALQEPGNRPYPAVTEGSIRAESSTSNCGL